MGREINDSESCLTPTISQQPAQPTEMAMLQDSLAELAIRGGSLYYRALIDWTESFQASSGARPGARAVAGAVPVRRIAASDRSPPAKSPNYVYLDDDVGWCFIAAALGRRLSLHQTAFSLGTFAGAHECGFRSLASVARAQGCGHHLHLRPPLRSERP